MQTSKRDFLGTGWKFPLQVDASGGIARASSAQRVEESIYLILGTAKGERVLVPDFGCGIHDVVFEPNSTMTRSQVTQSVRDALVKYEKRIDVLNVDVESTDEEPNLLLIRIAYRIRANNAIGNLVYPFYIDEGR